MIKVNERVESFVHMCFWLFISLMSLSYLTGCTNWQGGGIRIGWENYNGAHEVKEFKKETKPGN